jgi:hypothetical protein
VQSEFSLIGPALELFKGLLGSFGTWCQYHDVIGVPDAFESSAINQSNGLR